MDMNCEYCNKVFKSKSALNNHKNKAIYCLVIQKKITKEENELKCSFCKKVLSTKWNEYSKQIHYVSLR